MTPFSPEVVAAVCRHMNDDHADSCLLICRAHGQPDATSAVMTGLDGDGIDFLALVDGHEVPVRVPFAAPVRERAQVRSEIVRLHRDAAAALGVEPTTDER